MHVDDAAVDNMTQSQSQPQLTSPGSLLRVMNSNGAEVVQCPAGASTVPPPWPLVRSREEFVGDMDSL